MSYLHPRAPHRQTFRHYEPGPARFQTICRGPCLSNRLENSKPPLTTAISAPWGTGKTTLALQVQEQLKTPGDWNDDHIICEFSAWKHDDAPNLGAAFAAKVAQAANEERYWWRRLIQPLPSTMLTPEQRWRRKLYVILASLTVAIGLVLGPHTRDIITAAAQPTGAHWTNAEHAAHGFGLTLIIIFAAFAFTRVSELSGGGVAGPGVQVDLIIAVLAWRAGRKSGSEELAAEPGEHVGG